ncbi:ankyrin repeat-containing domain protein [Xylariaceae sp. AK1471]|nr:ankyrin repeat-containing domain protein [Xylariaceae sp. AK1471]
MSSPGKTAAIASIINGFEGLGNIPHAGVLKFLHRHPAAQGELFKCFNTQSSPVTKSFAENVFLACVESDNIDVVRFLINKKLVDVNEAVCHFEGERYTPLQHAAIHQSFKVVQHLINPVDVNKSISRACRSNPLDLLIRYVASRRSTLDENFLKSVDDFLKEKATISMDLVQMVLTSFVDERLADRLLKNLTAQALHTLLSQEDLLRYIVKNLAERDAITIFDLVNDNYRNLGGEQYLCQFHQQVDSAFHEAAEREYNELVGIMLPYASSPHRALQTAMEAENNVATQLILKKYPDLEVDLCSEDSDTIISALESNDYNLLRGLETRGVFDRLRGHELGQVLTKALKEGNGEYATKILGLDPDFKFYGDSTYGLADGQIFDVSSALSAALAHDFHDIAWKLLSVGLTAPRPIFQDLFPAPLLYVALDAKKLDFVRAIMEYGVDDGIYPLLESAIELDQDSIFDDLWKARPSSFIPTESLLKLALEKRGEGLFFDIIKSSPEDAFTRMRGLVVAVECEAESLFDELISFGARADDDKVLEKAIEKYPSMVKPLLDRYWKAYPQGRAGYGRSIISSVLNSYPTPYYCLSLDELVTWNLLNPNHLHQKYPEEENLLLKAIAKRNYAIVKKFIDAGSDVNSIIVGRYYSNECPFKTTALLSAIETEIIEIVELLLNHGAKVNEPARLGIQRTPLQKAAEINNIAILQLLLDHGADINAIPAIFHGATALQIAAINGNCEIATILIEHWAQQDIPPPRGIYGRWPLEGAAENGRFDMIELLWNAFGSFPEEQCQSAMRYAERNGHIGCKERIQELMAGSTAANNRSLLMAFEPYEYM